MCEWSIKNTELWGVSVAALGVFELWNKEMDFANLTFTVWLLKILNFASSNHLAKPECKLVLQIETDVNIFFPLICNVIPDPGKDLVWHSWSTCVRCALWGVLSLSGVNTRGHADWNKYLNITWCYYWLHQTMMLLKYSRNTEALGTQMLQGCN